MEKRLSRKLSKGLKELDKLKELVEFEREVCAEVAESMGDLDIADAIRGRKIVTKVE